LEVGHEDLRARVERVDDHLAIDGAGDLDPTIQQVRRNGSDAPFRLSDLLRLGQEVGQLTGVVARLALGACAKELEAPRVEAAMQLGKEVQSLPGQDLLIAGMHGSMKRDALRKGLSLRSAGGWNGH